MQSKGILNTISSVKRHFFHVLKDFTFIIKNKSVTTIMNYCAINISTCILLPYRLTPCIYLATPEHLMKILFVKVNKLWRSKIYTVDQIHLKPMFSFSVGLSLEIWNIAAGNASSLKIKSVKNFCDNYPYNAWKKENTLNYDYPLKATDPKPSNNVQSQAFESAAVFMEVCTSTT